MFCPNCGAPNPDTAAQCGACGTYLSTTAPTPGPGYARAPGYPAGPVAPMPAYLAPAILTTLFCCMPLGIVAIVHASEVQKRLAMGDMLGAQIASQKAKTWSMVSFLCGLVSWLVWILMVVTGGL